MQKYPDIFRVRQHFERPRVEQVAEEVERQLARLDLGRKIQADQTVAITAGSRGIANIRVIIKAIADHVRRLGGRPLLVPGMDSHGGGTAEGQRKILESYGITESFCGCPIRSNMETVVVCQAAEGFPVHFDREARVEAQLESINRGLVELDEDAPAQRGVERGRDADENEVVQASVLDLRAHPLHRLGQGCVV